MLPPPLSRCHIPVLRSRLSGSDGRGPWHGGEPAPCGHSRLAHALTEPVLLGALDASWADRYEPCRYTSCTCFQRLLSSAHHNGSGMEAEPRLSKKITLHRFGIWRSHVLYPIIKGNVNTIFARLFSFSLQPAFLHHIWCFCLKCHLLDQYIFIKVYRLKALPQGPFFDIIIKLQTEENEVDTTMNVPADIWAKVLSLMENDMTATTINTWFDDARAVALEENRFILHTPSNFKRDIILSRYLPRRTKGST